MYIYLLSSKQQIKCLSTFYSNSAEHFFNWFKEFLQTLNLNFHSGTFPPYWAFLFSGSSHQRPLSLSAICLPNTSSSLILHLPLPLDSHNLPSNLPGPHVSIVEWNNEQINRITKSYMSKCSSVQLGISILPVLGI